MRERQEESSGRWEEEKKERERQRPPMERRGQILSRGLTAGRGLKGANVIIARGTSAPP